MKTNTNYPPLNPQQEIPEVYSEKGILIYGSFYEAMQILPDKERLQLYDSICSYSLYGTVPKLRSPLTASMFKLMQPNIDATARRYQIAVRNGKKGGRPKKEKPPVSENENPLVSENENPLVSENENPLVSKNENPLVPKSENPLVSKSENLNVNGNVNGNGNGNVNGNGNGNGNGNALPEAAEPPARAVFSPPKVEAVLAYCRENGYRIDAQGFVDHYTSNGWMVGKAKMKDWKAAVRNWSRKEEQYGKTGSEQAWPALGTTV